MTEKQELCGAFPFPTESDENYWIDWALTKWVEGDQENILSSYASLPQNTKKSIINELLGSIGSRTLLPLVVDFVMQGTTNRIALFGVALMLLAEADDTTLQSCGIVDGTDLKTTITYCKTVGNDNMESFLTHGKLGVLIPLLQNFIAAAGKIRDAQCELSGSGPAPKME